MADSNSVRITGSDYRIVGSVVSDRRGTGSVLAPNPLDALLRASGFQPVGDFTLEPSEQSRRRTAEGQRASAGLDVAVGPDEMAVLLVEDSDGVLHWHYPDRPAGAKLSGRRTADTATGTMHFTLSSGAYPFTSPERRGPMLDWVAKKIAEPVRVKVLRFLVKRVTGLAVDRIEGDLRPGLVDMRQPASASWVSGPIDSSGAKSVLLMVHGTFSTTQGSFDALDNSPFMVAARAKYDLVLGFDHYTLRESPLDNARQILQALHGLDLDDGCVIDAVAFSRGGLVYRTLAEQLAAETDFKPTFGTAVFVGCTNAGTLLAEPQNWEDLVDLYTNIISAGASTALSLAGGQGAAPFVAYGIGTIGRFVQLLSQMAVSERRIPGLAAMEPDGEYVQALNGREYAGARTYHVIATDFQPAKGESRLLALAARFADRLYKDAENDLVVHTASMSDFGKAARAKESIQLPADAHIYHTAYFSSDRVQNALMTMLGLSDESVLDFANSEYSGPLWREFSGKGWAGTSISIPDPGLGSGFRGGLGSMLPPQVGSTPGHDDFVPGHASPRRDVGGRSDVGAPSGRPHSGKAAMAPPETAAVEEETSTGPLVFDPDTSQPAAAAAQPDENLERYIAAEMEPNPPLGQDISVFVTLSPDQIRVAGTPAATALDTPFPLSTKEPVQLRIVAIDNCKIIGKDTAEIILKSDQEQVHRFRVRGIAAGPAIVTVIATQGQIAIPPFTLRPQFVAADVSPLREERALSTPAHVGGGQAVLRVYEFRTVNHGVELLFNLTCKEPQVAVLQSLSFLDKNELKACLDAIYGTMDAAWNLRDQQAGQNNIYQSFLDSLMDVASVQSNIIMPAEIRRALWDLHQNEALNGIQIISNEAAIPWEVLCLSNPDNGPGEPLFLAELNLFRWLADVPEGRKLGAIRAETAYHVIPDYVDPSLELRGADAEKTMLVSTFPGIKALMPSSTDVREFLSSSATACSLLHFACHGEMLDAATKSAELLMNGRLNNSNTPARDGLKWETVERNACFGDETGPLVFVNACQTGRSANGLSGPVGFAPAFLKPKSGKGAAAFIGALWSVDDQLAHQFAKTVYSALQDGAGLAAAVQAGRTACQSNHDFTWLAYCVYGQL